MRICSLKGILLVSSIVVIALVSVWTGRSTKKPSISIGVLSYDLWGKGPAFSVRLGVTNTSRTTIRYNQLNFSGDALLRTESQRGWTTRDIGPGAVFPLMPALLPPGSNAPAFILLPADTLRWQIRYPVRAASPRDRVMSRLPPKWRGRLRPLCERVFSAKEGPEQQIASDVFELPLVLRARSDETPAHFDSDPFPPAPVGWER